MVKEKEHTDQRLSFDQVARMDYSEVGIRRGNRIQEDDERYIYYFFQTKSGWNQCNICIRWHKINIKPIINMGSQQVPLIICYYCAVGIKMFIDPIYDKYCQQEMAYQRERIVYYLIKEEVKELGSFASGVTCEMLRL